MTAANTKANIPNAKSTDDPRSVALLAKLVRAFRAREIELRFDEQDIAILRNLAAGRMVDLSNDGFVLGETQGTYLAKAQTPPVTAKGILFLERLPIDQFVDQPGLFRFLGWL